MKKLVCIFCGCALIAASCSQHEIGETPLKPHGSEWDFYSSFDDESSRTLLNEQMKNVWSSDDRISIFMGNSYNHHYKFNGATGDTSGTFSKVDDPFITGEVLSANYAIYPYSAENSIDENGVIHTSLPAVQIYHNNSFGLHANTMVAVTESLENRFLGFQNVCGYVRVKLYGDNVTLKSVSFTGNNEEILAGTAQIAAAYNQIPHLSMAGASTKTLTVDCGDGVKIGTTEYDATSFVFVVPPTAMENGFTIVATDVNGNTFTKVTNNPQEVKRNTILTMPKLKWTDDSKPKFEIPEGVLTIHNEEKGMLLIALMDYAYDEIVSMKITGTMNDEDFLWIYYEMPALRYLDISEVNITTFPNKCFYQSSNVETLIMPNSLQIIPDSAFYQSVIKEVYLNEGLQTIGESAFRECNNLESIHLPQSLTALGRNAFWDCEKLTSITFEDGCKVSKFEGGTFAHTPIVEIRIPAQVASMNIGGEDFDGCSSLTTVRFEKNSVLPLMSKYFYSCKQLESVEIPASVITIDNYAFSNKTNLKYVKFEPNSNLQEIKVSAFAKCISLESIVIPSTIQKIYKTAFYGCSSLTDVQFAENSQLTDLGYGVDTPSSSGDDGAFESCVNLKRIEIPASVRKIHPRAFYGCSMLNEVVFEQDSQLEEIGGGYYYNNPTYTDRCYGSFAYSGVTNIIIPKSVTVIGAGAFLGSALTSITFESGSQLKDIQGFYNGSGYIYSYGAFEDTELTKITLPEGLTTIGDSVFRGCNLSSVTFPASLKTIGVQSFAENSNLTLLNFNSNSQLESIGKMAFYECGAIHYVYAQTVTNLALIGSKAFYGCDDMRLFKLGTVAAPKADSDSFGDIGTYSVLKVPTESVAKYKAATGWKGFSSITGLDE